MSSANKAFVVGEMHRQHMCHRPARRRRQLQRLGRHVSFARCHLYTYVVYVFVLSTIHQALRGLNLVIVEIHAARETTIDFFVRTSVLREAVVQTRTVYISTV